MGYYYLLMNLYVKMKFILLKSFLILLLTFYIFIFKFADAQQVSSSSSGLGLALSAGVEIAHFDVSPINAILQQHGFPEVPRAVIYPVGTIALDPLHRGSGEMHMQAHLLGSEAITSMKPIIRVTFLMPICSGWFCTSIISGSVPAWDSEPWMRICCCGVRPTIRQLLMMPLPT